MNGELITILGVGVVLAGEDGRTKPCSVYAASWFPLPKP